MRKRRRGWIMVVVFVFVVIIVVRNLVDRKRVVQVTNFSFGNKNPFKSHIASFFNRKSMLSTRQSARRSVNTSVQSQERQSFKRSLEASVKLTQRQRIETTNKLFIRSSARRALEQSTKLLAKPSPKPSQLSSESSSKQSNESSTKLPAQSSEKLLAAPSTRPSADPAEPSAKLSAELYIKSSTKSSFESLKTTDTTMKYVEPSVNQSVYPSHKLSPFIRPLRCDNCNPHEFRTMLSNPLLCVTHESVPVVFLVHSRPDAAKRRDVIRATWAARASEIFDSAPRVFVVGRSKDKAINDHLRSESRWHGDILQEDFIDSYYNMTHKAVGGLKWIAEFCHNAEFIFKVDDDVIVNVDKIKYHLDVITQEQQRNLSSHGPYIGCKYMDGSPNRKRHSKWFVSRNEFPSDRYPRFCFGFAVLYSMEAAVAVAAATTNVPYFKLDDVYVTGLVASGHLGLNVTRLEGVEHWRAGGWCHFKQKSLAVHLKRGGLLQNWRIMVNTKCVSGLNGKDLKSLLDG